MRSGTGLEMERKREKAEAVKEIKIMWDKVEQRGKIWKDIRWESEGRKNPGVKQVSLLSR